MQVTTPPTSEPTPSPGGVRPFQLLRALRVEHWIKNGFLFAPMVFAGSLDEARVFLRVGLGFLCFCFVSSAVYLMNDLADAPADRLHPAKKHRPIASGTVTPLTASIALSILLVAGVAAGFGLAPAFAGMLLGYFAINVLYTLGLKNMVILDVFAISAGFVLRVESGALLAGVTASTWLLVCTTMLALFLGFSKRRYELQLDTNETRKVLSDYSVQFLDKMMNVVEAVTLVAYLMYAIAPETEARVGRGMLLTVPFVLYGIFRYQYLIYHKNSAQNPTDTLLTDRPLLVAVAGWLITAAILVTR
jgi:4-hydroxybenzoate polyprenyltransferase